MTIYSFACSAPDNWRDWHFLVKTFGPISITGFIALAAYKVARTQREIASNKYNLDLFISRLRVYEDFVKILYKIKKGLDKDDSSNNEDDNSKHDPSEIFKNKDDLLPKFLASKKHFEKFIEKDHNVECYDKCKILFVDVECY
ncbi:hypothetical protein, partial [Acetobacter sp. DmW_125124]